MTAGRRSRGRAGAGADRRRTACHLRVDKFINKVRKRQSTPSMTPGAAGSLPPPLFLLPALAAWPICWQAALFKCFLPFEMTAAPRVALQHHPHRPAAEAEAGAETEAESQLQSHPPSNNHHPPFSMRRARRRQRNIFPCCGEMTAA